jgi:hypothetical protein
MVVSSFRLRGATERRLVGHGAEDAAAVRHFHPVSSEAQGAIAPHAIDDAA